jgi:hypothetical protein
MKTESFENFEILKFFKNFDIFNFFWKFGNFEEKK